MTSDTPKTMAGQMLILSKHARVGKSLQEEEREQEGALRTNT